MKGVLKIKTLPFRQIHLDYHTSEAIKNIGQSFLKENFQKALKTGHVNSITLFSKCHHGWAYHPSEVNDMHPHLEFDLLGSQIEACKEIGVKTQVYISAGLDEKLARKHPEWLIRHKDESTTWVQDFMSPGYHALCFNSPYLDVLLAQIEEVVATYDTDGIFLDIVGVRPCYCQNCVNALLKRGQTPFDEQAVLQLAEEVYANYTTKVKEVVHHIKPSMRIFHNGGHIRQGRRDLAFMNTHLELESLPTGGWGYDHFPMSARYVQNLGIDFLGMTGKFHTSWGEFGGFKHPNALRYETALSLANGAKCSIGDQLHPEGKMDMATYKLIGKAYEEVEEKEQWCDQVTPIADIAILTSRSLNTYSTHEEYDRLNASDIGATRMLLEGHYLFNIIDKYEDFHQYKVIILPDYIRIDNNLRDKLSNFCNKGGSLLATGESGLAHDKKEFLLDFGVRWISENPYNPDYFKPKFDLDCFDNTSFVFYGKGQKIELKKGEELGIRENPYFNRHTFRFCSHQHTPNSEEYGGPGMVKGPNGIYISWNIFEDYATKGSLIVKKVVHHALEMLLGTNKTLITNLPAQGITTLMDQKNKKRFVHHLLHGVPVKRGNGIEVIEDITPLHNITVTLSINKNIKHIYFAPQMITIPFQQSGKEVTYSVDKVDCHQMVVLDYEN